MTRLITDQEVRDTTQPGLSWSYTHGFHEAYGHFLGEGCAEWVLMLLYGHLLPSAARYLEEETTIGPRERKNNGLGL